MDDLRKPLSFSVGKGDYLKIGIIILVVFIICLIVLLSLGFASLFTNSDTSTDNDTLSWMSGALGGLISIVLALFTFLAFYVQYLANQKIQNQFREQQANEHFHKMLELHKSNIDEFSIKSHDKEDIRTTEIHTHGNLDAIIKTVDSKSLRSNNYQTRGRRCFILMLNDLHYSIQLSFQVKAANRLVLKDELVLKLAYRIFFWGSHSKHVYPENITKIEKKHAELIVYELNKNRITQSQSDHKKCSFYYYTSDGKQNRVNTRFVLLSGHSSRLAHYYRHLYQTAKHVHYTSKYKDVEFLKKSDIDSRFKALRSQMTNEEQLLLYYNYRYGFGGRWDYRYDDPRQGTSEFRFFTKYLMLHNVPLYDTMHAKAQNPVEHFQEYKDKFPTADLFEWGGGYN